MLSIELEFILTWHIPVKGVYFLFCVQIMAHLPVIPKTKACPRSLGESNCIFLFLSSLISLRSPFFLLAHWLNIRSHVQAFGKRRSIRCSTLPTRAAHRQSQINEGPWNPSKSVWAEPFERLASDGVVTTKWLKRWLWLLLITSRAGVWDRRKSKKINKYVIRRTIQDGWKRVMHMHLCIAQCPLISLAKKWKVNYTLLASIVIGQLIQSFIKVWSISEIDLINVIMNLSNEWVH